MPAEALPSFLSNLHRAGYAEAARFERDERARIYRARAKGGEIEALAEADWQAWVAIARWCASERTHAWEPGIAELEHAARLALQQCDGIATQRPDDEAAAKRRDDVAEILSMLQRTREWIGSINAALRRRAGAAEAA